MDRELSFRLSFQGSALPVEGSHKFFFVDSSSLDNIWEFIEPIFISEPETWNLGQTLESIYDGLKQDAFFLLLGTDWKDWVKFLAIVAIEKYPAQKFLHIPVATGFDFGSYVTELADAVDYLAYRLDCDSKLISGRGGWERILLPHGYQRESVRLISQVERRSYH